MFQSDDAGGVEVSIRGNASHLCGAHPRTAIETPQALSSLTESKGICQLPYFKNPRRFP